MAFLMKEFIIETLINGVKNGAFPREYAYVRAVEFVKINMLTEADVQKIVAETTAKIPEPELLIWTEGENVEIGDKRIFGGVVYECLQAHMTQVGWEPGSIGSAALWREVI